MRLKYRWLPWLHVQPLPRPKRTSSLFRERICPVFVGDFLRAARVDADDALGEEGLLRWWLVIIFFFVVDDPRRGNQCSLPSSRADTKWCRISLWTYQFLLGSFLLVSSHFLNGTCATSRESERGRLRFCNQSGDRRSADCDCNNNNTRVCVVCSGCCCAMMDDGDIEKW